VRQVKDTLAAVIDASPVAIVCSDPNRHIMLWSRAAEQIFGYTADEVIGHVIKTVPPEEMARSESMFHRALNGQAFRDVQSKRLRKDGSPVDIQTTATPLHHPDGTVRGVVWVHEDITNRMRAEEQMRRLAHYDRLTGLPNRLSLQEELERLLTGDGCDKPTSVALFDLDGFKDVNDTLGHSTGDKLLIEVGQRLVNVAEGSHSQCQVCRLGGDEFVAIIPNCGDPRLAVEIVESMLKRLAKPFSINDHVLHLEGSAGIAIAPADGSNVDELIANADLALYQAKSDGGQKCRFFMPVLRAQAQARRAMARGARFLSRQKAIGIEQAGGRASTGNQPILEVQPQAAHERIGFVFGARNEVERIERYHRDHNEFEYDAPLFGTRGLFTTHV